MKLTIGKIERAKITRVVEKERAAKGLVGVFRSLEHEPLLTTLTFSDPFVTMIFALPSEIAIGAIKVESTSVLFDEVSSVWTQISHVLECRWVFGLSKKRPKSAKVILKASYSFLPLFEVIE